MKRLGDSYSSLIRNSTWELVDIDFQVGTQVHKYHSAREGS